MSQAKETCKGIAKLSQIIDKIQKDPVKDEVNHTVNKFKESQD